MIKIDQNIIEKAINLPKINEIRKYKDGEYIYTQDEGWKKLTIDYKNKLQFISSLQHFDYKKSLLDFSSKFLSRKYNYLYKTADNLDISIKKGRLHGNFYMEYGGGYKGFINIDPNKIYLLQNYSDFQESFVHECIHGIVNSTNIDWEKGKEFENKLEKFYLSIMNYLVNNSYEEKDKDYIFELLDYIGEKNKIDEDITFTNYEELITYGFSDPKFAKFLSNIPVGEKYEKQNNIWDKLKDDLRITSVIEKNKFNELINLINKYYPIKLPISENPVTIDGTKFVKPSNNIYILREEKNGEVIINNNIEKYLSRLIRDLSTQIKIPNTAHLDIRYSNDFDKGIELDLDKGVLKIFDWFVNSTDFKNAFLFEINKWIDHSLFLNFYKDDLEKIPIEKQLFSLTQHPLAIKYREEKFKSMINYLETLIR